MIFPSHSRGVSGWLAAGLVLICASSTCCAGVIRYVHKRDIEELSPAIINELNRKTTQQLLVRLVGDSVRLKLEACIANITPEAFSYLDKTGKKDVVVSLECDDVRVEVLLEAYLSLRFSGFSEDMTANFLGSILEVNWTNKNLGLFRTQEDEIWDHMVQKYAMLVPERPREFFGVGAGSRFILDDRRCYLFPSDSAGADGMLIVDYRLVFDRQLVESELVSVESFEELQCDTEFWKKLKSRHPEVLALDDVVLPDCSAWLHVLVAAQ